MKKFLLKIIFLLCSLVVSGSFFYGFGQGNNTQNKKIVQILGKEEKFYYKIKAATNYDGDKMGGEIFSTWGIWKETWDSLYRYLKNYEKALIDGGYICVEWEMSVEPIDVNEPSLVTSSESCVPLGDCDDNDPNVWRRVKLWVDLDEDGHATGTATLCIGDEPPPGYSETKLPIGDCAPDDPTLWRMACVSTPIPGKPKQWTNASMCVGNTPPSGSWFCKDGSPTNADLFFTVYPNPVSERLNITTTTNWNERAEIKLIDQYARIVRTLQVPNAVKGQTLTINTSDLKPGLYQLTIRRGEMIESKTIAVKL